MLRTTTLAVLAALALAPAANAAESVRVSLAGKSAAQIHVDVVAAARTVCHRATATETLMLDAYSRCTAATVKAALSQLADPQVAQLEASRVAQR
jgi:hypothetical protein